MFDAELYRKKSEVSEWKKRDPIPVLTKLLAEQKLITEKELKDLDKKIEAEMQQAVEFAEAGTWEPNEELKKYAYSEEYKN